MFDATITIPANASATIKTFTFDFAPSGFNPGAPFFKLSAQPRNATTLFTKVFSSSTAAATVTATTTEDGMLASSTIPGTGQVKVIFDTSAVVTDPSTLPSTLPGDFKAGASAAVITVQVRWTPDLCKTPGQIPCAVGNNIAGGYDVEFAVEQSGGVTASSTAMVTFVEQPVPTLTVTTPSAGQGFGKDDLAADPPSTTTDSLLFKGTASGGVANVTLVGSFSEGFLVGAPVGAPVGPFDMETAAQKAAVKPIGAAADGDWGVDGLWHVTGEKPPFLPSKPYLGPGTFGMYYGNDPDSTPTSGAFNYDTLGVANSGGARSPKFTIGAGTTVRSSHWFDTEFGTFADLKDIQFCPHPFSPATCVLLVRITDAPPFFDPFFDPFAFLFGPPVGPVGPPPGTIFDGAEIGEPGTRFVFIPNFFFGEGTMGYIRFFFDTLDGFANDLTGWYFDNVSATGAGVAAGGPAFPVTPNPGWSGFYVPFGGQERGHLRRQADQVPRRRGDKPGVHYRGLYYQDLLPGHGASHGPCI